MIKTEIHYNEYDYCTNCNKEVDTVTAGAPISGIYFVCPFCGRAEADISKDGKGLETRRRNIKKRAWLLIEEISD